METRTRIDRLESDIEDIRIDVADLKDGLQRIRYGGILAFIVLAGMIATAYFINDYKVKRLQKAVSSLTVAVAEASVRMSAIERQNRQILKGIERQNRQILKGIERQNRQISNKLEELTGITP